MQNFATPIPSVPVPDVIVQIPEESESNDNPPDYSNFLPPSYEEAVERENISIGVHTGVKTHFLSRNSRDFDISKM